MKNNNQQSATPNEDVQRLLDQALHTEISQEATEKMSDALAGFKDNLQFHPAIQERSAKMSRIFTLPSMGAWLKSTGAVMAAGLCLVLGLFFFTRGTPTWAQVMERFQSVPFASAVVYMKDDALAEPIQYELWMGQGQKVRVRTGNQIVFGEKGQVLKAYDLEQRKAVDPAPFAARFIEMLSQGKGFSLETVLNNIYGGELVEMTPQINSDASISQDMVVFDVVSDKYDEWFRMWALRETQLPVRIRIWDPQNGACTDVFLTYSHEQSSTFFDPNAFGEKLSQPSLKSKHLIYADLKDPGGRILSPLQHRQKVLDQWEQESADGYHMPTIKEVGMTPDGMVWVRSTNANNLVPNGHRFFGFKRLEDNLGRHYLRIEDKHHYEQDWAFQIFVPQDHPFDTQQPKSLTIICEAPFEYKGRSKAIGSIEVTEWISANQWEGKPDKKRVSYKSQLARHLLYKQDWARFDRIQKTIPGDPNNSMDALYREMRHVEKHIKRLQFEHGAALAEKLLPSMVQAYQRITGRSMDPVLGLYSFCQVLAVLARNSQLDLVKQTFETLRDTQHQFPEDIHPQSKKAAKKQIKESFDRHLKFIVEHLIRIGHLDLDQVSDIVGFEIDQSQTFSRHISQFRRMVEEAKRNQAAEQRLREISTYYKTHPLPTTMDLLKRKDQQSIYISHHRNTLPLHPTHQVFAVNHSPKSQVSSLRVFAGITPYTAIELRIEESQAEQELFADIVCPIGTTRKQRLEFLLEEQGLELVIETGTPREVLVVKYNGQKLKDYHSVVAPIPNVKGQKPIPGNWCGRSGSGYSLNELLEQYYSQQNQDIDPNDRTDIYVDETGITGSISSEAPYFPGPKGKELAIQWFQEEFGITFTKEQRSLPIYIIRKKQ